MILKRYLLLQWLKPFAFSMIFFIMLITIATFVDGFLRDSVSGSEVLLNYLFNLPKWIVVTVPFACLTTTLFSLEGLRSKNELVAIYAAGFSFKDLTVLISQIVLVIAFLEFIFAAYIVPSTLSLKIDWLDSTGANFKKNQFRNIGHSLKAGGKIWFKQDPYYFSFLAFDKEKNELIDIMLYKLDGEDKFSEIVWADKAKYISENNWQLNDANRIYNLEKLDFSKAEEIKTYNVSLGQEPNDLSKIEAEVSTLHPLELFNFILQIKKSGISSSQYEVQLFEKISQPLLCLLFAILPLLGFSSSSRRSSSFGLTVTKTITFCILFWLANTMLIGQGLNNKIPSFIAVFSIPLLFIAFILYGYKRREKLL